VLVVDDERKIRDTVRAFLERRRYAAPVAGTGQQALDMAGRLKPDLVVLDLMLPDLPGEEVARSLRVISQMPIIMLTAKARLPLPPPRPRGAEHPPARRAHAGRLRARDPGRHDDVSRYGYAHLYRSGGVPQCQPGQPVRIRTRKAPSSPPALCAASGRQQPPPGPAGSPACR